MIDRGQDGRPTEAFYVEAEACESCGEPTFRARVWNQEYQLWVAVDCSCNVPDLPTCPLLIPALTHAQTVREVCQVIREHRATCSLCRPVEMPAPKQGSKAPAIIRKQAA